MITPVRIDPISVRDDIRSKVSRIRISSVHKHAVIRDVGGIGDAV
jgi:hypothetical protein